MTRTHIPSDTLEPGERVLILPARTIQKLNKDDLIKAIKWFEQKGLDWCDDCDKKDSEEMIAAYESDYGYRPQSEPKSCPGYIYAIQGETVNGFVYKIGQTSRTPEDRLADFEPKLPFEAKVYWSIRVNNMDSVEKGLHRHFADYRTRGEWFALNEFHLRDLDNLAMGYDDAG